MFALEFFEDIDLVFEDHFDFRFFEALQFEGDCFIVLFVFGFDYFAEAALAEEFLDFVVGLEVGVLAQGGQGVGGSLLFHLDYITMEEYLVIYFSIFVDWGWLLKSGFKELRKKDMFMILILSFGVIFFMIFIYHHDKIINISSRIITTNNQTS